MNNVYEKAERQLAVLKSKAAGYRLQGATEERGEEIKPLVLDLYSRIIDGDESALDDLVNSDLPEDPSYKLNNVLSEIAGLEETLSLPLAQTGLTKYLITDGDLVSPAGYYNDGVYIKNSVWIETNRLPRAVEGLTVYNLHEIAAECAA
jgi:hypothetical protein